MKTLSIAAVVLALTTSAAFAEGSKIEKSTLVNASSNKNVVNAAIGEGASANTGSVSIKGSEVTKSTIVNATSNQNAVNAAIGKGASANTGSIDVK